MWSRVRVPKEGPFFSFYFCYFRGPARPKRARVQWGVPPPIPTRRSSPPTTTRHVVHPLPPAGAGIQDRAERRAAAVGPLAGRCHRATRGRRRAARRVEVLGWPCSMAKLQLLHQAPDIGQWHRPFSPANLGFRRMLRPVV